MTASQDFVNVFFDVSGSARGYVRRNLSSLFDVVSSGLWTYVVSRTCSHHPSRVDSVCLAQTKLPSTYPPALHLFVASSYHHRRESQHPLCLSLHHSPSPLVLPLSLLSLSLAKLHYDYPHLVLGSSKIEYWASAHSCLAFAL